MDPASSADPSLTGAPGLPAGAVVAGRYRIECLLGTGGMGAVYRAEHVHMRKTVALKVLHPEVARVSEVVARFEREAIAAGRIEHPNVVAASDFGKLEDGSFYLVLEFVDGTSLRELLASGPLPTARAVDIARQTALALVAAHGAEIVHRDLKPDNVMLLREPDGSDRVKVLDFGIARVAVPNAASDATHLTRVGVVMGTIAYMSPEQATGQAVDGRTDLYSLGVMLHEMLTGRQPFEAELPSQVLARQLVEPPPPLPPEIPPALRKLVVDLMAKSASERPQSAREVLDRLSALEAPPVLGPSWFAPRASWRSHPRARLFLGLGLGVAALLLLGVVFALLGGDDTETATAESAAPPAGSAPSSEAGRRSSTAPEGPAKVRVEPATGSSASKAAPATGVTPAPSTTAATKGSGKRRTGEQSSGKEGRDKRKTGPGGIYIPPPDQWFK